MVAKTRARMATIEDKLFSIERFKMQYICSSVGKVVLAFKSIVIYGLKYASSASESEVVLQFFLKLRLTLIFIFDIVSVNSVLMSSFSSQPTVQVKLSPGI